MDSHTFHTFVGTSAPATAVLISFSEVEAWLRVLSLVLGICIGAKLKEPSTIRGLAIIGGVAGLSMEPAKWDAIGAAVAAVIGLIEIFRKEK
jgi:hypothetical protein